MERGYISRRAILVGGRLENGKKSATGIGAKPIQELGRGEDTAGNPLVGVGPFRRNIVAQTRQLAAVFVVSQTDLSIRDRLRALAFHEIGKEIDLVDDIGQPQD